MNFERRCHPMSIIKIAGLLTIFITALTACHPHKSATANIGTCPEQRLTEFAPAKIAALTNPLPGDKTDLDAGENLYHADVKPVACVKCHGEYGDGNGVMATMFQPAPRNFACANTMLSISDGQLYWIIKNGSVGTSMPAFSELSDKEIWQLVIYLRSFSSDPTDSDKAAQSSS